MEPVVNCVRLINSTRKCCLSIVTFNYTEYTTGSFMKASHSTLIHPNLSFFFFIQITREKLEEMKGIIPRAGPKYRLGMYFETIHNLPSFDDIFCHDEEGYTSYWETDTDMDSDLGNFVFNNITGDSASLICLDDTTDLLAFRKRQQDAISSTKCQPHYKLEQNRTSPTSPSEDHQLERSDSKHSSHSRQSHRSGSDGTYDHPPPVPPPRRPTMTATSTEFEDHTYETLDDCHDGYLAHQGDMIYVSKGSDGSRDSHGSTAKPASNNDAESDHISSGKGAEDCGGKYLDRNGCSGCGDSSSKPRSMSLQSKARESVNYRQRRKMSDPSSTSRKRRSDKVASKGSGYPAPVKGFPAGLAQEYVEYLSQPTGGHLSPERNHTGSPVASPCQREIATGSPDRRNSDPQKSRTAQQYKKTPTSTALPQPLVIKHKGKTYFVPVVDQKLERELEKRSRTNNPTVSIRHQAIGSLRSRPNGIVAVPGVNHRPHASPPKVEPSDCAAPNKKKSSSYKSPQHTANPKQVTHYGVL